MDQKRKMRHILDWLLGSVLAGSLSLFLFFVWMWLGMYSPQALNEGLDARNYYETQYQLFKEDTDACLAYLGIPEGIVDEGKLRTRFLVESKQSVLQAEVMQSAVEAKETGTGITEITQMTEMTGNVPETIKGIEKEIWKPGTEIREKTEAYLNEENVVLTVEAEAGLTQMETFLNASAMEKIRDAQIEAWKAERQAAKSELMKNAVWAGGIAVIAMALLIAIQHEKRRALKYIGAGWFAAGAVVFAGCLIEKFFGNWSGTVLGEHVFLSGCFIAGLGVMGGMVFGLMRYVLRYRKQQKVTNNWR